MTPTPEQIAAGVAKAKEMLAAAPVPDFLKDQVTDDQITGAVTDVVTAALNATPPTDTTESPQ
jgi:hypothetical protein